MCVCRIEKVFKVTPNFEHNNFAHVTNAHQIITLAVYSYLYQDVTSPPPALLSRNINVYLSQVENASGIAMIGYLKHVGNPLLQWQRASRECNVKKYIQLLAYSYHVYRSVSHKPVAARIVLIGLLGFCCTIPAIQAVLAATFSVSLLGTNFMYIDRLIEYLNQLQQGTKRSSHAASFGRAMDMTTLLPAMLHVRHAFQNHELGVLPQAGPSLSTSQLVAARKLQNYFFQLLGRDLTIPTTHNQFWHTGIPVPLQSGSYHFRRPHEWLWNAARGATAGKGRARRESWDEFAVRMVYEHFFPY